MRKYTVIPLTLNGKGNRIYRSGDVVSQEMVDADVKELVKGGYLKEVADPKSVKPEPVAKDIEVEDVPKLESEPRPSIDDMTRAQIIEELKAMGVAIPHNAKKADLYALL